MTILAGQGMPAGLKGCTRELSNMMLNTLHTTRISYGLLVALVIFAALSDFLLNPAFQFLLHLIALLAIAGVYALVEYIIHPVVEKIAPVLAYLLLLGCWTAGLAPETNLVLVSAMILLMVWFGLRVSWAYFLNAAVAVLVPVILFAATGLSWRAAIVYFVLLSIAVVLNFIHEATRPEPVPHSDVVLPPQFLMTPPVIDSAEPVIQHLVNEFELKKPEPVALPPTEEKPVAQPECHEWASILRELHNEMKTVTDVDGLFKRMLVFMSGAVDFSAAAVGMIQEQSINRISVFGQDALTQQNVLSWSSERLRKLASERETLVSQQNQVDASGRNVLHRLDIPIITNDKLVGLVTVLRANTSFSDYENALLSSIVFYGMIALRHARLQEEMKRLSAATAGDKKTFFTREQFIGKAGQALTEYKKPRALSFMLIELDEYAAVLKAKGPDAVARLYKTFASTVMAMLRANDILGAYGKEGFIVMVQDLDVLQTKDMAEQIRKKLSQSPVKTDAGVVTSTVSIGVTTVSDQEDDMATLIRKAGMGLFVAKESGKNAVKVSL
jgi:diguanylate cyclase (GGDEF)-like protein